MMGNIEESEENFFGDLSPEEQYVQLNHNKKLAENAFHIKKPDIKGSALGEIEMIPDGPLETESNWKQRYYSLLSAYNNLADTLRDTK